MKKECLCKLAEAKLKCIDTPWLFLLLLPPEFLLFFFPHDFEETLQVSAN